MPFVLINASSTSMTLAIKVFHPCLGKFFIVYLNYTMIYIGSRDEHLQHLNLVLEVFNKYKVLHVSLKKCEFFKHELAYLGCTISWH